MSRHAWIFAHLRSAIAVLLLSVSSATMADPLSPAEAEMVGTWVTASDEVVSIRVAQGNELEVVLGEAADGRVLATSKLREGDKRSGSGVEFAPVESAEGTFRRIGGKYAYLTQDGYLIWRRSTDRGPMTLYEAPRTQVTPDPNLPQVWRRKGSDWPQYQCHGEKWKAKLILTGGFQGRLIYSGHGVACDLTLSKADLCPLCRGLNDIVEYRVTNCGPAVNAAPAGAEDSRSTDPIQHIRYSVMRSRYFTGIEKIYATPIASHLSHEGACSLISEPRHEPKEAAK